MTRRSYSQADKGQVYCVECPEWHVECAAADCTIAALVANSGDANTAREAERLMVSGNIEDSGIEGKWTRRGGLWFCPDHNQEKHGGDENSRQEAERLA